MNSSVANPASSTDRLISYLTQLLENNAIGERELVTLREGSNPIPHEQTQYGPVFETSARRIQYQVVQTHMQSGSLDQTRINAWVDKKLQENSKVRVQREEVREETQNVYRKIEFHRLPPGEFTMEGHGERARVKLTHEIEMMSTPITQKMWVEVMGENPSYFKEGLETDEIEINGKRIPMQPDHPAEKISWWSAVVFANRLSEKHGLKPAYDLSEIKFSGKAEDGTLRALEGKLKIAAPDGDIYRTEGFRLPTVAEQEYVLSDLGRTKSQYPHDLTESQIEDHAWLEGNSGGITHAVGTTLKSLRIGGKAFDDLLGNVMEWGHDSLDLSNSENSVNPAESILNVNSGLYVRRKRRDGDFSYPTRLLFTNRRAAYSLGSGYRNIGARLVRTIK